MTAPRSHEITLYLDGGPRRRLPVRCEYYRGEAGGIAIEAVWIAVNGEDFDIIDNLSRAAIDDLAAQAEDTVV